MKKNGYTVIELLGLIAILGLIALITLPQMSHAFVNDKEEVYQNQISIYLKQAEKYGESNKDTIKKEDGEVISIQDLIDKGYIGANEDGKVIDLRDNKSILNELKIKLIYDADSGKILAQLA